MAREIKVPDVGESIREVQIGQWLKQEGDQVEKDEDLVELESEKATVQVPSPAAGRLGEIIKQAGEFAEVGEVIARLEAGRDDGERDEEEDKPKTRKKRRRKKSDSKRKKEEQRAEADEEDEAAEEAAEEEQPKKKDKKQPSGPAIMPAAQRLMAEYELDADDIQGSGDDGRILKEDVEQYIAQQGLADEDEVDEEDTAEADQQAPKPKSKEKEAAEKPAKMKEAQKEEKKPSSSQLTRSRSAGREEQIVPMSMIRRTIARRLVEAQRNAALLTTFNDIDMSEVVALRSRYRDKFQDQYGVKLGFMSFFVKAAVEALKRYPQVNAEIREQNVVYHNYYDIGVAIGSGKGLVVPVLRNAETMSFAEVEAKIADFARRAGDGKLEPGELEGGTFTISNGGIYGSMLSTPILNPPQSGVLGLHAIDDRPVARDGQVVVRPMMYVALSYDHRIVDGREAVGFLRTIKDVIEDPPRLFLEI